MGHLEGEIDGELNFTDGEIDEIAQTLKESRKKGALAKKPKSEKRQRGVVVSVRMTTQEFETISNLAEEAAMSLGGFMRGCAMGGQITQPLFRYRAIASTSFGSASKLIRQPESNLPSRPWIDEIESFANSNS